MRISKLIYLIPAMLALSLVAFITLPLISLFLHITWQQFMTNLHSELVLKALKLSAVSTTISALLLFVMGTPLAYFLARVDFPGKGFIDAILDLPMVLPPAVAGLALLMAFGRVGTLSGLLNHFDWKIAFSLAAVVMAQIFVAAPFFLRAARQGFASIDSDLEKVAQTLGKNPWSAFWTVTMPLAVPAVASGLIMAWARALGEFGATIMFAGNMPGVTQTLPLAVYTALESDLSSSLTIAVILVLLSLIIMLAVKVITGRSK